MVSTELYQYWPEEELQAQYGATKTETAMGEDFHVWILMQKRRQPTNPMVEMCAVSRNREYREISEHYRM